MSNQTMTSLSILIVGIVLVVSSVLHGGVLITQMHTIDALAQRIERLERSQP